LTGLGWLQDLQGVAASSSVDTWLDSFLIYLDIFFRYVCDKELETIGSIIAQTPDDGRATLLIRRAMVSGREAERSEDIGLLEESEEDYLHAQRIVESLEPSPERLKTLAQAYLGRANIVSTRADLVEDEARAQELRRQAITLYERALEPARGCDDALTLVTIWGELCHTWTLLEEWKHAKEARDEAAATLDKLEDRTSSTYEWDRAWVLNLGANLSLRKGRALSSRACYENGYQEANQATALLEGIPHSRELIYYYITAGDCAWGMATLLKGASAEHKRRLAFDNWHKALEAARETGQEQLVTDESVFYEQAKG
jgi:hypothetical protein